ncbi:iron-sulfur cluster carrier protein ApbC [Flavobacterium sp. W21_SRS_FM6]|uniref:iron-sulfur cluster carrier protein ApbC n=1 Tax=Flavobacterium sp. W21_SRS_FM6 TaxID=3240268 RepID=UPI003F92DFDA
MFFKSKSISESLSQNIQLCLTTFFNLPDIDFSTCLALDNNTLVLTLPFAAMQQHLALKQQLEAVLLADNSAIKQVVIQTSVTSSPTLVTGIANVKNIIAVASGKGGVGKSTTTVNLAFALQAEGAKVGILDADIYGPSIPLMLGNAELKPTSEDQKRVDPLAVHGVVATSIGYFVPAENATVWRGPMASKALLQLLNETNWPELDYLIVDMPPGTGDIQLTLAQQMPVSAAVIVTTPQDLALADATKGIAMFNKVKVPVLGIVENMSFHVCSQCGHHEAIFAEHGAEKLAAAFTLPLLGQLPLDIKIRQHADGGKPLQLSEPQHALSLAYQQLARETTKALWLKSFNQV